MYLSRIELDTKRSQTMRALASPQVTHAIVEGCFEDSDTSRKLWRIDALRGKTYLLVLSEVEPNFTELSNQLCSEGIKGEVKDYSKLLDRIEVGNKYYFRLCANPTYRAKTDELGKAGPRYAHVTVEQQLGWLAKKELGFKLVSSDVASETNHNFSKKTQSAKVTLKVTVFEGVLEVTDKEEFIKVLTDGLGKAKAYGCGLLTVVPV